MRKTVSLITDNKNTYETHDNGNLKIIQELCQFIDQSPTSFHAIQQVEKALRGNGFMEVKETEAWKLNPGGKYYVIRNDAALMAFTIPDKIMKGFHVFAAHSDSPAFKVKHTPEMVVENQYVKLNTEQYGGMILATWFDRPLAIAGRVMVKDKQRVTGQLVNLDENLCMIPNVAIHMNREMNQSLTYNPQTDLLPLYTLANQDTEGKNCYDTILELIATSLKKEKESIFGNELYVYNREKTCLAGAKQEFIMGPRLDDLECVFAGMKGLLAAEDNQYVNVLAVFHNEEVGSLTRQGADSTFLKDTLENVMTGLQETELQYQASQIHEKTEEMMQKDMDIAQRYRLMIANSFMISADNAHACHPNHTEKADPTNKPFLNKGIVIKFHGGQKYATDAYSEAVLRLYAEQADVPCQTYYNRSDIAGGSTLGNIAMAQVSMPAVDIGLPQLAMHSAFETAGAQDLISMVRLAECFYQKAF